MIFYNGYEHHYLTEIFKDDSLLQEVLYNYGLLGEDAYETFSYKLADMFYSYTPVNLMKESLSANEIYDEELAKTEEAENKGATYDSFIGCMTTNQGSSPRCIQEVIDDVYGKIINWTLEQNRFLYVSILKSFRYGSIKHFFYENRKSFLPAYDWFLITQEEKRKAIVEALFTEFDKLTTIVDSIKNYTDADAVPNDFLIYLMELTGTTVNGSYGVINEQECRDLAKQLIEIYRTKGSLFSFELFFNCLGVDCGVKELWFDRRLYHNPTGENEYSKADNVTSFEYYLTPKVPSSTSYSFAADDQPLFSDIKTPISKNVWDTALSSATDPDERGKAIRTLLGITKRNEDKYNFGDIPSEEFTFFKTNFVVFNFKNIVPENTTEVKAVSKTEATIYQELIDTILPVFIQRVYSNWFESDDTAYDPITYGTDLLFVDTDAFVSSNIAPSGSGFLPEYIETGSGDSRLVYVKGTTYPLGYAYNSNGSVVKTRNPEITKAIIKKTDIIVDRYCDNESAGGPQTPFLKMASLNKDFNDLVTNPMVDVIGNGNLCRNNHSPFDCDYPQYAETPTGEKFIPFYSNNINAISIYYLTRKLVSGSYEYSAFTREDISPSVFSDSSLAVGYLHDNKFYKTKTENTYSDELSKINNYIYKDISGTESIFYKYDSSTTSFVFYGYTRFKKVNEVISVVEYQAAVVRTIDSVLPYMYFELDNNVYSLTSDKFFQSGKTYYLYNPRYLVGTTRVYPELITDINTKSSLIVDVRPWHDGNHYSKEYETFDIPTFNTTSDSFENSQTFGALDKRRYRLFEHSSYITFGMDGVQKDNDTTVSVFFYDIENPLVSVSSKLDNSITVTIN